MRIMVINGPNLNMLGIREPNVYGKRSYEDLVNYISNFAKSHGVEVKILQSNHEGDLVDYIQRAQFESFDGIVINPAAYTHTSIAILDGLKSVNIPAVEVHLTDISNREEFRRLSYISEVCIKTIVGKGFDGYIEGIKFLIDYKGIAKWSFK